MQPVPTLLVTDLCLDMRVDCGAYVLLLLYLTKVSADPPVGAAFVESLVCQYMMYMLATTTDNRVRWHMASAS